MVTTVPERINAPPAHPEHRVGSTVLCASCKQVAEYLGYRVLAKDTLLLKCRGCGAVVHNVKTDWCAHAPADERAHEANVWPQPGPWEFLGMVRGTDGAWVPIARTKTLGECWDQLDSVWLHGDRLVIPVRPSAVADDVPRQRPAYHTPRPGSGLPPPGKPENPARPRTDPSTPTKENCKRCGGERRIHWRTLKNQARVIWSKCTRCR